MNNQITETLSNILIIKYIRAVCIINIYYILKKKKNIINNNIKKNLIKLIFITKIL